MRAPLRAILTYHSIDSSGSPISITPEAFAGHVRFLAQRSVRVLSLSDLVAEVRTATHQTHPAVALTFDDGFANFAEHGAPRLIDAGLPATMFIVSRSVGSSNIWNGRADSGVPQLPLMDWDVIGRLAEQGIEFGAHTRTHPSLAAVTGAALNDEIEGSAEDMVRLHGRRPRTFAYPYGIAPAEAAAIVRNSYGVGVTTKMRPPSPTDDLALIPRLDAYYLRQAGGLDGWNTARFRGYVQLRAAMRTVREYLQK